MTLVLASNNAHKIDEIRPLLHGMKLRIPKDLGLDFDFPEHGSSFLENALGKAMALHGMSGQACLADDSGLCVDALGGRPGVYSARYGSKDGEAPLPSPERNALLLSEMEGRPVRSCRFICCLALVLSAERVYTVQESCEGILLERPRGEGGFGYDPIVFLPELGKSVAELSQEEKNRVSHRGKALARLKALLEGIAG
jgi:XTP/dITP diphosphohydrolase